MPAEETKPDPIVLNKVGLSYRLGIPISTIDDYIADKTIPYHKFRGNIRFELHEVLEATKVNPIDISDL